MTTPSSASQSIVLVERAGSRIASPGPVTVVDGGLKKK
jgi:hypothetical protein